VGAVERAFNRLLWQSRLLVLTAVVASGLLALGSFYMATVDVVLLLNSLIAYASPHLDPAGRAVLRDDSVTGIVKAVDGYLIGAIVLIFGLGLYELFINRIQAAAASEQAPRLIQVTNLDDLKDRIAKLILLVLVIEYFVYALKLKYENALDLLYLAVGILLIGGALYLSGPRRAKTEGR